METKTINDREGLLEDIRQARKIVLCAHVSPDGDTLGSSLAMRLALEKMGKQVCGHLPGRGAGIPFLPPRRGESAAAGSPGACASRTGAVRGCVRPAPPGQLHPRV